MAPISLRGVRKSYGEFPVIHGVDLEIASGEFIVILGPSGCGKSTLLRMVAGLEDISGGEIAIDERVVNNLEPRERGCAMVFQNYALYPHMSVAANIGYALKVAGVPKEERQRRVENTAKIVGLSTYLDRKPAALSGGQRQRVAMARAIIREPKVFLFDEPLSNLDAKLRVVMRAEIRRLHKQLFATSIFVTHDQHEAMTLADRIIVMNGGQVEQVGTPQEIYHSPATRFVAAFVGTPSMNLLEGMISDDGAFVDGSGNRVDLGSASPQAAPGSQLVLGVRAEAVRLVEPGAKGALVGTADFVEELGATRVVHAVIGGTAFAVVTNEPVQVEPGARLGVMFDSKATHFYSAETGAKVLLKQELAV
ncbi:ABC transporter ATP-binding protein [Agrobacterium fabrum]|uniref:ABC transporter ATP-binding protein n=1 Tax=Agrobacterium fabrum TaxID=1176649 RepID=UPI00247587DA|nr:sn-glycerol-3-phosphate ABC transporter ATP-binding protein UgpC [Agrobacterium fabrum]MDH6298688.1 sn-glycerol 3-phosphate transport system ATP-binding protein [Agrobacterium fabrum]